MADSIKPVMSYMVLREIDEERSSREFPNYPPVNFLLL